MKYLVLASILFSMTAFAGGGSDIGNGGTGIVCYDKNREIASAQVLDLWEGQILDGRIPEVSGENYLKLAKKETLEVEDSMISHQGLLEYLTQKLIPRMQFLPKGVRLQLTGDVNTVLQPPTGCEYGQIINFANDGRILVDSDIWAKLDNVHKAALLTHEVLYHFLRHSTNPETNSVRTRKVVSWIYSGRKLNSQYVNYKTPSLYCFNKNKDDRVFTEFAIYENNNALKVDFYYVNGKKSLDRIFGDLFSHESLKSIKNLQLAPKFDFQSDLKSDLDPYYQIMLGRSNDDYVLYITDTSTEQATRLDLNCSYQN